MATYTRLVTMNDPSYRTLFDHSPVAIFLQDFSGAKAWLDELRASGVEDLRAHLAAHPDLIEAPRSKVVVKEMNQTAVTMFGERMRQVLVTGVTLESEDARTAFVEQLVALWEGRSRLDIEFSTLAGAHGPLDCLLGWSVRQGSDGTLDPSHVVVTIADISAQRAADRQVEQQAAQLDLLHQVSLTINGQRSLDEIFTRIVDGARDALAGDQARLIILDEAHSELLVNVGVGASDEAALAPATAQAVRDGISGWVLQQGEPTLSAAIDLDERNRRGALEAARASSYGALAMAPLSVNNVVVGTLAVLRRRTGAPFRTQDLHVLTTLATHAGYAVQNARLLDQLEQSLVARDRMLAQVSHELRTPLTAVIGMAGTVRDNAHRLTTDEIADYLSVILDQSRDLAAIVEDLLTTATAEAGPVDIVMGPVDLWQQTAAVSAGLGEVAATDADAVEVIGDPLRVRQIVRNLITNARRHGGPTVTIRVRAEAERGLVEVADDGSGVSLELQPRLFQPFEHGGIHADSVGLGLSVSKELAVRMGGELIYERRDGWSVFSLALELAV